MDYLVKNAGLGDVLEKIQDGERLNTADGIRLFESPDLLAIGYLANMVRELKNGNNAYFIYNQHINYSNICQISVRTSANSAPLARIRILTLPMKWGWKMSGRRSGRGFPSPLPKFIWSAVSIRICPIHTT
jgi:hypothetical protein